MQKNYWLIKCNHNPETIDRIMMPFRKRGMTVNTFEYKADSEAASSCKVEFEMDEQNAKRVYNNLIRMVDINTIEVLA